MDKITDRDVTYAILSGKYIIFYVRLQKRSCIMLSRVRRLYETGFGLAAGFIGLNSITQLVITPYSSL
jgi:hypothetical protein